MKYSLATTGLSLAQAQSITNLMNQRANDIAREIDAINNSTKTLSYEGETLTLQVGHHLPDNVVDLLKEKATLHSVQGFLMENIKAKDRMIETIRRLQFTTELQQPEPAQLKTAITQRPVDEDWAWNQLSPTEYNEYLEQEALAAHIGQFIHKNGKLDTLRKELAVEKPLEWIVINQGTANAVQKPVKVAAHHTSSELLDLHNKLAAQHREYEQRVNYFKAKVKNMVTEKNSQLAKENANAQSEANRENESIRQAYTAAFQEYQGKLKQEQEEFESKRQQDIMQASALRIQVDPRFQAIVTEYTKLLTVE
jgi:hypothetical protein